MARRRVRNKHLPRYMVQKHGAYYHVRSDGVTASGKPRKVWRLLSREYGEALRLWAEIEGRPTAGPATVADLLALYVSASATRLSDETVRGYTVGMKRLGVRFGAMHPDDLRREHVFRYLHEAGSKPRGGVAANRDRALLGAAYTYAQNLGLVSHNPAHGLRFRNPERPRGRYITDDELQALIAAAPPRFALLLRWAYATAMRETDIARLLLTAGGPAGVRFKQGKTGREVLIAWSDELREIWRDAAGSRIGAVPVFLSSRGEAYTANGIRSNLARARERAGVRDVVFHDLRRKGGSDVEEAHTHALLGNSPEIARKHYRAKLSPVKPAR